MKIPVARIASLMAFAAPAMLAAPAASAHGVLDEYANPWRAWNLTPDIALATLLVAGLYIRGLWRLRHKTDGVRIWRHLSFLAGLAAVFLALQSPLDPIAERSVLIHQIQHFLLRMIGPMLIFLSAPQGILVAGTPRPLQRHIVNPVISNHAVRGFFALLTRPATATALFVAALYFWQIPKFHNLALLNHAVHYLMHVSLLFVGLLFFWRVFDARSAPVGTRYGVRLMMLWIMTLSNIVIGSYLAFKGLVLYPAYDALGRLWNTPLTDEQMGSIMIWIPSSMMGLVAILIVIHMWGRQETKDDHRRAAKLAQHGHGWNEPPMAAADLIARAAPKNRIMAIGFSAFVLCVFVAAVLIGVVE